MKSGTGDVGVVGLLGNAGLAPEIRELAEDPAILIPGRIL